MQQVLMPKLGQTMEEAKVEKWHKKEGDEVSRGEVLLEITTDKATLEVESYFSGTLRKIIGVEGETLPVNAVLALVGEPDEPLPDNLEELKSAPAETAPEKEEETAQPAETAAGADKTAQPAAAATTAPPPPRRGRIFASPRARMRSKREKISLMPIQGSGPNGRIVEKDILEYAEKIKDIKITPAAREEAFNRGVDITRIKPASGRITREEVLAAQPAAAPSGEQLIPLSSMRKVVAERMSQSKREIPHFYLTMDFDMTAAVAYREQLNSGREKERKISFHDLLLRACGIAFFEQPAMNTAWSPDGLIRRGAADVGLAVALEEGLIVPVIRNVDTKNLEDIAADSRRLIEKARGKRLTPDEYQGGCMTISNLGMFSVDSFLPIINPGETAIIGVGRIARKPVVIDEGIHIRSIMTVTICADHRAVDGAIAAAFLARVRELLESPEDLAS